MNKPFNFDFLNKPAPSIVKNNPYGLSQLLYGGAGLGLNMASLAQGRDLNTQAPTPQTDAYGRPAYNLGAMANEVVNFKPQGAGVGDVLSGVGQGAAAGSVFGAPGTIIGGFFGGIGTIGAGMLGQDSEEKQKREAMQSLQTAKAGYNRSMESYNQNYLGREAYEDQLRMFNMPTNYV